MNRDHSAVGMSIGQGSKRPLDNDIYEHICRLRRHAGRSFNIELLQGAHIANIERPLYHYVIYVKQNRGSKNGY